MDRIRVAVVDGLHKIPHGGIEIGGVLFGTRQADCIRIADWQPIECEHALGPSFSLSATDEAGLRASLEAAEAKGLEVVGWFHSHTRSDLRLTERDQSLHERFFPDLWQVALVLRPTMLQPTRAAFFRRRSEGSWDLHPDEFLLEPPEKLSRATENGGHHDTGFRHDQHSPSPITELSRPASVLVLPVGRKWEKVWRSAAAGASIIALAGLLFAAWRVSGVRSAAPIALNLQDSGGRIRISWNSQAAALHDAQEGRLIIQDGAHSVEHRLSPEDLRRGSMQYLRSADNVQVRLTVLQDGKQPTEEWTSFIGPASSGKSAPDRPSPAQPLPTGVAAAASEEEKTAEAARIQALKADEARLRAEMQHLEQARIKAEQERAAHTRMQAERERQLQRMAEETKKELARLQELKAAPAIITPSAAPELSPVQPAQAPLALKDAESDAARTSVPPVSREPGPPRYSGPASGRIIWTGDLPKTGTLSIEEARASLGVLTGRLPRVPVRIRAYPAELSERGITIFTADPKHARGIHESPSRQNGWNQTTYKFAPGRAAELSVVESPGARNNWHKIVLRNDSKRLSMIVLDWELIRTARR